MPHKGFPAREESLQIHLPKCTETGAAVVRESQAPPRVGSRTLKHCSCDTGFASMKDARRRRPWRFFFLKFLASH